MWVHLNIQILQGNAETYMYINNVFRQKTYYFISIKGAT